MKGETIVILGGGVGGVVTANELRGKLGKEHRVVLVDKGGDHVFWPSLLWLQVGLRKPERIVRDLASLEKKGIEVVKSEVRSIDPAGRAVTTDAGELVADHLVISLGADLAPEQVPGLSEAGHNLYTLEGATSVRDTRKELDRGKLVVLVSRMPFKCPAAPYEAAMLLDHDLRKRKVRDRVSVALFSPEPGPMGVAGPEVSAGVRGMVEDREIAYHPRHVLTAVDPQRRTLEFENGARADFDYLVYIPPHVAPPVVREAGLTGESGWVTVDRHSLETRFSNVFAIGDVTGIPLSVGLPLPKAGTFAHHQGSAVARTIACRVSGKGEEGVFDGGGECFVEVGGGKAGFGRGNFYAEPSPDIKLRNPTRYWHAAKVLFEKDWFRRWL